MLNPFRSGFFAVQLVSHKVMRYAVPVFLVVLFAASAILAANSLLHGALFAAQLAFYLSAGLAWVLDQIGARTRLLAFPQYFVIANLASVIALYKLLRGERYARWEPLRGSSGATRDLPSTVNAANLADSPSLKDGLNP
jgi:hypothetical protein